MKLTDKKLKKLLREHPIPVTPAGKEEFLKQIQTKTGGIIMKKRNLRLILAAAIVLISLTMLVSAGAIAYYYRTPGGLVISPDGAASSDITDTSINDSGIRGEGYHIHTVTWAEADGQTTLAVWAEEDNLEGLTAIIDGKEIPLIKNTFNMTGKLTGYTTTDIAKPSVFTLSCTNPPFSQTISFTPEEIMAESSSNGMILFGSAQGNKVYIGVNAPYFLDSVLSQTATIDFVFTQDDEAIDNEGNVYSSVKSASNTDRETSLMVWQEYELPAVNFITSLASKNVEIMFNMIDACSNGTAISAKIPVPENGETLTGSWELLGCDGFSYVLDSVTRNDDKLIYTSADGITYHGDNYTLAADNSYHSAALAVNGAWSEVNGGGGDETDYEIRFDSGVIESLADENGMLDICVYMLRIGFIGNWHLDFGE